MNTLNFGNHDSEPSYGTDFSSGLFDNTINDHNSISVVTSDDEDPQHLTIHHFLQTTAIELQKAIDAFDSKDFNTGYYIVEGLLSGAKDLLEDFEASK